MGELRNIKGIHSVSSGINPLLAFPPPTPDVGGWEKIGQDLVMVVLQPKKKKLTNQQLGTGVGQEMLLEEIKEKKKSIG